MSLLGDWTSSSPPLFSSYGSETATKSCAMKKLKIKKLFPKNIEN